MVQIAPTTDLEQVLRIATHRRLYRWMSDDYSPAAEKLRAEDFRDPRMTYLLATAESDDVLGMFGIHAHNGACVEIHTCLLPTAWGAKAREAASAVVRWLWNNTSYHRLITNVPIYNQHAMKFAVEAGMEQFGVNRKSFMKDGILHDQIMLGLNRPEDIRCLL